MAYFPDLATVKSHSIMPSGDIDGLNAAESGWILARALSLEGDINGRLRKRYAVPFATPIPEVVLNWLGALLDPEMYLKRGINPSDEQQARIEKRAESAEAKIKEAADAEKDCTTSLYGRTRRTPESSSRKRSATLSSPPSPASTASTKR